MNENQAGILYIVGTPIGNLEDMTYRAVRVLREADVIAAEDTRHTRKLLSHFDIHTTLISYHEHNKADIGSRLIERLLAGQTVAIVSDAGMPGISDPGADLARLAIEAGVTVTPIPGASAALCGLVASGLDTRSFVFVGFLPKTAKKRRAFLEGLAAYKATLIFYESPHHLNATLSEMELVFGQRPAVVARELTKKFEQFVRGTIGSVREYFQQNDPRGEFTIIVEGSTQPPVSEQAEPAVEPAVEAAKLIAEGMNKKDAIRKVASSRGLSKREVYNAMLEN